jgi:hypothetical protein
MKVTFDHNCLIHLEGCGEVADTIRNLLRDSRYQCYVVNVGASEMQRFGVRPDNYGAFEELLNRIGVGDLPRLNPVGIYGVTFWDHCLFAGERDQALLDSIRSILFPTTENTNDGDAAQNERRDINRLCDALTMCCHIGHENEAFLTTDGNFFKASKLPKLLHLGAGRICRPNELIII